MVPLVSPPPGIYVATGPGSLTSWFLNALCPALAGGARLFWIDAGNSFNAYGAGYASRSLGADPRTVLSRISLARPFNLFQLATMVSRKAPALWRGEPIVLSDPFPMLYDEDVPIAEARRVFVSVLEGMRALPAVWMLLVVARRAPPGRDGWFQELAGRARGLASLQACGLEKTYGPNAVDHRADFASRGRGLEALPPRPS
jgi:hypothetical protein